MTKNHIKIFTDVYEKCIWGNNNDKAYLGSSGEGSSLKYNQETYIPFLREFIIDKQIKSVADLGCGDWQFSPYIYENLSKLEYIGYDAYKKVINANKRKYPKYKFVHLDVMNEIQKVKNADLCIFKDVLQHWSNEDIYKVLDYVIETKKFKYILITNCCNQEKDHHDSETGKGRFLTARMYPLKKYNPEIIYTYHTKETSIIWVF